MIYVIIIVVISMMIGPILWLRPTPRERHQAKLRAKAISLGLSVSCPGVQRFKWAKNNKLIDAKRLVRYTLSLKDRQFSAEDYRNSLCKGTYFRWIYRGEEEWQWHEVEANKLDNIASLTALFEEIKASDIAAVAIDLSFNSCSLYWHEAGNEASVDKIKCYLNSLSQLIITEMKRPKHKA